MLSYILIITGLFGLIIASITDIKTREVPDWLNYFLITAGLGLRLIYSVYEMNFSYILYGLVGFGVFFLAALLMYYTKQWGGGDSKLLMGLGALFGSYPINSLFNPNLNLPFLLILLINIILVGGVYGILWALYLGFRNWKNTKKELKKIDLNFLKYFSLLLILPMALLIISFSLFIVSLLFLLFVLLIAFILIFIKAVENCCMYKNIDVNKLTEGDWVAHDIKHKGRVICRKNSLGLTKKDIILLKKYKFKNILIKEGIPFVPSFLIGFLISLIFGNIILII